MYYFLDIDKVIDEISEEYTKNDLISKESFIMFCEKLFERFKCTDKAKNESTMSHAQVCKRLNDMFHSKNKDYGDSFHKSYQQYGPVMAAIRLEDKLNRFKTITSNKTLNVTDESAIDTLLDLANYAIMTVMELEK